MFLNKKNKNKRGFMTVEVLISAFILTISLLATLNITQRSLVLSKKTFSKYQAVLLLEEGAEAIKSIRSNDWSDISSLSVGTSYYLNFDGSDWVLSTDLSSVGGFTRSIVLDNVRRDSATDDLSASGVIDDDARKVSVFVSWTEKEINYSENLQFYIFNIY